MSSFDAPKGQVWVCGHCRKQSSNRRQGPEGWDESCFLHAILCSKADLKTDNTGLAVEVRAAEYQ